jgi:acyl carrier protein
LSASTNNVPIGKQVEGKSIFILDNYGNLLPNGVIGEIYIGGSTISSGYINKPDVTAQYFVPNPFSELPGDRLYRTGDLASYAENGALNFWGRRDNQVKIRGMRIEIEEIESLLLRHQDISNIAVVVDIINKEEKRLVAYYVTKSKDSIHQLEFKDYLSYKIPDYMIPSIFIQLEEMPVTAIGKIDRKALPKPDNLYNELITTYAGPRTSVEEKISSIVAEVLDLEKVGIYDNFFELGGHSILAIQFVSKVKKEFGVNLPLGYIFEYPNVALLSSEIVKLITQTFEDDNLEGLLNLVE